MPTRQNIPIFDWQSGDSVAGFALVTRKERRQDRNARDYIDLELTDNTGTVFAKIWADSAALDADFEAHDFVAFRGIVKSFREQIQLSIDQCRRATDDDREHGFDEALLIPSTPEDPEDLWRRLEAVFRTIERPHLDRLTKETLTIHGKALKEHPAAKTIHHAYRGGLLEHVVSMAELASMVAGHYPELDRDLLLVGVLFHDLGKLLEIGAMPANDYTPEGQLVGHVVIGRDLLRERCAAIPGFPNDDAVHLEHLVLSHQGRMEYGAPVEPRTAEALALHMIDNLDAKLAQLRQAARHQDGFQYLRGLGRWMYLGPQRSAEDDTSTNAADAQLEQLELGADSES
ncbi:MAG: HD domain-containing protein [bacterium]|nr:HD domain-containing protein [bacterium]